jgi:hypothetical protein
MAPSSPSSSFSSSSLSSVPSPRIESLPADLDEIESIGEDNLAEAGENFGDFDEPDFDQGSFEPPVKSSGNGDHALPEHAIDMAIFRRTAVDPKLREAFDAQRENRATPKHMALVEKALCDINAEMAAEQSSSRADSKPSGLEAQDNFAAAGDITPEEGQAVYDIIAAGMNAGDPVARAVAFLLGRLVTGRLNTIIEGEYRASNKYLTIGGETVYQSDLLSLYWAPTHGTVAWFTEPIYTALLTAELGQYPKVYYFRDAHIWLNSGHLEREKAQAERRRHIAEKTPQMGGFPMADITSDAERILFIYNPSRAHWISVEVILQQPPEIRIYDPNHDIAGSERNYFALKAARGDLPLLFQYASVAEASPLRRFDWHKAEVVALPCTQQSEKNIDCGPWAIYNLTLLAGQGSIPQPADDSDDQYRHMLGQWIRHECTMALLVSSTPENGRTDLYNRFRQTKTLQQCRKWYRTLPYEDTNDVEENGDDLGDNFAEEYGGDFGGDFAKENEDDSASEFADEHEDDADDKFADEPLQSRVSSKAQPKRQTLPPAEVANIAGSTPAVQNGLRRSARLNKGLASTTEESTAPSSGQRGGLKHTKKPAARKIAADRPDDAGASRISDALDNMIEAADGDQESKLGPWRIPLDDSDDRVKTIIIVIRWSSQPQHMSKRPVEINIEEAKNLGWQAYREYQLYASDDTRDERDVVIHASCVVQTRFMPSLVIADAVQKKEPRAGKVALYCPLCNFTVKVRKFRESILNGMRIHIASAHGEPGDFCTLEEIAKGWRAVCVADGKTYEARTQRKAIYAMGGHHAAGSCSILPQWLEDRDLSVRVSAKGQDDDIFWPATSAVTVRSIIRKALEEEVPPLICEPCGVGFDTKARLQVHYNQSETHADKATPPNMVLCGHPLAGTNGTFGGFCSMAKKSCNTIRDPRGIFCAWAAVYLCGRKTPFKSMSQRATHYKEHHSDDFWPLSFGTYCRWLSHTEAAHEDHVVTHRNHISRGPRSESWAQEARLRAAYFTTAITDELQSAARHIQAQGGPPQQGPTLISAGADAFACHASNMRSYLLQMDDTPFELVFRLYEPGKLDTAYLQEVGDDLWFTRYDSDLLLESLEDPEHAPVAYQDLIRTWGGLQGTKDAIVENFVKRNMVTRIQAGQMVHEAARKTIQVVQEMDEATDDSDEESDGLFVSG